MAGCAYYVIQRNDTTNVSIFHMSDSMQGVYSEILGVVHILFLVSWVRDFNPKTLVTNNIYLQCVFVRVCWGGRGRAGAGTPRPGAGHHGSSPGTRCSGWKIMLFKQSSLIRSILCVCKFFIWKPIKTVWNT